MLIKCLIPGTNLGFAYDPYEFTALSTKERNTGFAQLESRLDGLTKIVVGKIEHEGVPEYDMQYFRLVLEKAFLSVKNPKIISRNKKDSYTQVTWSSHNREGILYIEHQGVDNWILSAMGETGEVDRLSQVIDTLQKTIYLLDDIPETPLAAGIDIKGTICTIPEKHHSIILDILIGPVQKDLHLSAVLVEPDPQRQDRTKVIQGRQLLLYSRVVYQGRVNWNSLAIPSNGYGLIQLPRVYLGSEQPSIEGQVVVNGIWSDGQLMNAVSGMNSLRRQVTLVRPTPDHWMAVNGPDEVSIHRLAIAIVNNEIFAAQRGAIDLYDSANQKQTKKLDNDPQRELKTFPSFGEPVFAPCSGKIIKRIVNLPDQPVGIRDWKNPRGNEICIKRDDGLVIVLAHLRKDSILVDLGDQVEVGEMIAQVGNSGQTSEPHLHIHVANSEDQIADGVVFQFQPAKETKSS
jgi:peptidase M23-like protein